MMGEGLFNESGGSFIGHIKTNNEWLICLTAGVLAAALIALFKTDIMENAGIRQIQAEQLLMNWNVSGGFLIYLFICRGLPFYLLVILTYQTGRRIFFNIYFLYCGFSYGIQAVLLAMQYQLAGIPMYAVQMIPQIFFYLPALYLGYRPDKGNPAGRNRYGNHMARRAFAVSILLWTMGILAEWYVNPMVIEKGMKFFL